MTTLREAAQQFVTDYENGDLGDMKHYARALRAALAQQEQEPLSVEDLARALVASRVIDAAAIDDPDGYDDGVMLERVRGLHRRLAALEQQEQEPVAWMREGWGYVEFYRSDEMGWRDRNGWTPLYTHPPRREWVSLTEPVALFTKYGPPTMRDRDFWSAGYAAGAARAVEQACKERNT
jgi:biotin operon repressor